jgi:GT2 family glycosyltransferase
MDAETAKITLIFLLYNAEERVEALVEAAVGQCHPRYRNQGEWLDVVFMDDCSRDATLARLRAALDKAGPLPHFRVVANERNLGLSRTLNKAFGLIRTPYGLTCHLDVLFGREDYVAEMLTLMETHPRAGAITGQPQIPAEAEIPTAEKFNLISNLMDIFPAQAEAPLVPVGFAEGRCDAFRLEALKKAGFWDTTLHASGEDQILAARMRQHGYEIYQAPGLPYYLSVSNEQNSLTKLLRHAHLFGRTQPYILLTNRKTLAGVAGDTAGSNRQARLLLRATHLVGAFAYTVAVIGFSATVPPWIWGGPLAVTVLIKSVLFRRYFAILPLRMKEALLFLAFVPLQDVCYTVGLVQGLWNYLRGKKGRPIR